MSELDIEAIRARAENITEVRAVGPANFADLERRQLYPIAIAYAQDVPAMLNRITELEAENAILRKQREHLGTVGDAAVTEADALAKQHAAAMEIVRAVAEARIVSTDTGWALCWDATDAASEHREAARALLASVEA